MPLTRDGRNIVVKNSIFALAWYMIQHQVPPDMEHMMDVWYKMGWNFMERPRLAARLNE